MTEGQIEHQKKAAKKLFKAYKEGDPEAIRRVSAHLRDPGITLMGAQFVIARELGFKNWSDMRNSETK